MYVYNETARTDDLNGHKPGQFKDRKLAILITIQIIVRLEGSDSTGERSAQFSESLATYFN